MGEEPFILFHERIVGPRILELIALPLKQVNSILGAITVLHLRASETTVKEYADKVNA